jgi:hypothetical protein
MREAQTKRQKAASPPWERIFEVDYDALARRTAPLSGELSDLLRLFDGTRTLRAVVDANGPADGGERLKRFTALEREKLLTAASKAAPTNGDDDDELEAWLAEGQPASRAWLRWAIAPAALLVAVAAVALLRPAPHAPAVPAASGSGAPATAQAQLASDKATPAAAATAPAAVAEAKPAPATPAAATVAVAPAEVAASKPAEPTPLPAAVVAAAEKPIAAMKSDVAPAAKVDAPAAKVDAPAAKVDAPAAKVDAPAAKLDQPLAKVNAAAVAKPNAKVDAPAAKVDAPATVVASARPPTAAAASALPAAKPAAAEKGGATVAAKTSAPAASAPAPGDPERYQTLMAEGKSRYAKGQWKAARAAYTAALQLDPSRTDALVPLARCQLDSGALDDAFGNARRAIAARGDDAEAWLIVGAVEQQRSHSREARVAYQKYLALAPNAAYASDVRAVLRTLH